MTYTEHQEQQRRALDARRALDRAEMSSAQAARLARRISAQEDAGPSFDPMQVGTARLASAIELARIVGGAR